MAFDASAYLESLSSLDDNEVDLALTSFAIAGISQAGISIERYINHLKKLSDEVSGRHQELLGAGAEDSVETRLASLKHVLVDHHGYTGDQNHNEDLQNYNLIRVIDRAKGGPITLSILYIHFARQQGWEVFGLDVPGHFVCRLDQDGQRVIFDPFDNCKILEASDLRALVKKAMGVHAELSSDYFESAGNKKILIRLQNHIKFRQIEGEDYEGALETIEVMRLIDPNESRLLLEAGVLYAKNKKNQEAVEALEEYLKKAPDAQDRHEVALMIQDLKEILD